MTEATRVKAIVTMIGLDGHTTGGEVVAAILRDAGIEVVYLGVNQTPEMIAQVAIQEDVDVIGVSLHASNYSQVAELIDLLRENDADDIRVVCGGNIPRAQVHSLKGMGVAEVFLPGASGESIVSFFAAQARVSGTSAPAQRSPVG